ncbi:hypothetical protein D3C73_976120 [compost metagenome]
MDDGDGHLGRDAADEHTGGGNAKQTNDEGNTSHKQRIILQMAFRDDGNQLPAVIISLKGDDHIFLIYFLRKKADLVIRHVMHKWCSAHIISVVVFIAEHDAVVLVCQNERSSVGFVPNQNAANIVDVISDDYDSQFTAVLDAHLAFGGINIAPIFFRLCPPHHLIIRCRQPFEPCLLSDIVILVYAIDVCVSACRHLV